MINYKSVDKLRDFIDSQFRIKRKRYNSLCRRHQRRIAQSIKRARYMALIPYTRTQWRESR